MTKYLLLTCAFMLGLFALKAQTTILDFETAATSANFQYFGGNIDGTLSTVIANPDASGINTSANVTEFLRTEDGGDFGGGFTDPPTPLDLTTNNEICLKVWAPEPTQLLMKLEGGVNGAPNWELLKQIDDVQQWVEVCYNTMGQAAEGQVYNRLTLFFDFENAPPSDRTYYIDDVVTTTSSVDPVSATFSVDMNDYAGSFTTVFVSGSMNDWSGDANPLADDDGDGVWTGTITNLVPGSYEYKFTLDNWTAEEDFSGTYYSCTMTTGENTNRVFTLAGTTSLPTVCYESCYACGDAVTLTVNLGAGSTIPDGTFYIAGGGNFGNPGDFPLTANGDGTYSTSFELPLGFESFYTFTSGPCGDYSCKENIVGQDCSNPDAFDDRNMGPLNVDTTINTCFALCTDNTDCPVSVNDVTFSVDMNDYEESFTMVYVSGSMNDWSGDANPLADADGDGVWTATIADVPTGVYEYKFTLDNWTAEEDFSDIYYTCTLTTGENTNRTFSLTETTTLPTICFNSCYACSEAVMLTIHLGEGNSTPSTEGYYIAGGGNFGNPGDFSLKLSVDGNGNGVHSGRFELPMGFESFYTFTNGACPNYGCKENIVGQACSDPANFDDRFMGPLNEDTVIIACFEECSNVIGGEECVGSLPVELLSFVGRNVNGINELVWKTATEENSDYFEIQKSTDGVNFARIGTVNAAGTSLVTLSYSFGDTAPAIGNNYYRLHMVDLDATFDYSNVVQITTRIKGNIAVYPVPVNDAMYFVYDSNNTGEIQIQIINTVGQTLHTRTESTTQGINTFELNTNALAAGAYLIHVTDEKGLAKVKRFVKN